MSEPQVRTPAHLADHLGELVREDDITLVWRGRLGPEAVAALVGAAARGAVQVRPMDGAALAVWVQRVWFDPDLGTMTVRLRQRAMAA